MINLYDETEEYIRKRREDVIFEAEQEFDLAIVGYIMDQSASIIDEDAESLLNFLQDFDMKDKKKIIFILSTTGGYIEPITKMINTLNFYSNNDFEIFIPNLAKSAGTVLCLGATKLLMGLSSELGPVDTQISSSENQYSAKDYCDAYEKLLRRIEDHNPKKGDNILTAYYNELDKFDVIDLQMCEQANVRVKQLSGEILSENKSYKGKKDVIETITSQLTYGYLDHGDVVDYKKATKLGLNVEFLNPKEKKWKLLYEIYSRFKSEMDDDEYNKMFFDRNRTYRFVQNNDFFDDEDED